MSMPTTLSGTRAGPARKRCPGCKRELPLQSYHRNRARPSGLATYCKSCLQGKSHPFDMHRQKMYRRIARIVAVAVYGGRCSACHGTDRLEFHYLDGRPLVDSQTICARIFRDGRRSDPTVYLMCMFCHRSRQSRQSRPDGTA